MKVKINSVKFSATDKLNDYIEKKLAKLEKHFDKALSVDVFLKITKPESASNKEVEISLNAPNKKLFASKVADTFEKAFDECLLAIEKQIEKVKNSH